MPNIKRRTFVKNMVFDFQSILILMHRSKFETSGICIRASIRRWAHRCAKSTFRLCFLPNVFCPYLKSDGFLNPYLQSDNVLQKSVSENNGSDRENFLTTKFYQFGRRMRLK